MRQALTILALLTIAILATSDPVAAEEPASEAGGRLHGQVIDVDARPLAGVRVTATPVRMREATSDEVRHPLGVFFAPMGPYWLPGPVRTAETATDGTFSFADLDPAALWRIRAEPEPPRVGTYGTNHHLRPGASPLRLVVRDGDVVRGRITDGRGEGLRAWITLWAHPYVGSWWGGGGGSRAIVHREPTGDDGRFAVACPKQTTVILSAFVPEHGVWHGRLPRRARTAEVEVPLFVPGGQVAAGRVLDEDGQPVAKARVVVSIASGRGLNDKRTLTALAVTDGEGAWRVDGLPSGRITGLAAEALGYVLTYWLSLNMPLDSQVASSIDVPLRRGHRIEGRIVDDQGKAVAGARIRTPAPRYHSFYHSRGQHLEAVSDVDGRYVLDGVGHYPPQLLLEADGYHVKTAPELPATPVRPVRADFAVTLAPVVAGTVRDADGRLVPGVQIESQASEGRRMRIVRATTDARGAFRLTGISPSATLSLTATSPDGAVGRIEKIVRDSTAGEIGVVVILPPTTRVIGRVTDAAGAGIPGAVVATVAPTDLAYVPTRPQGRFAVSDAAGVFEIRGTPRGRTIRLALSREGRGDQEVEVVCDRPTVDGVRIVRPVGSAIAGTVAGEKGYLPEGAGVRLRQAGHVLHVHLGPEGRFGLTHLPPPEDPEGYRLHLNYAGTAVTDPIPPGTRDARLLHNLPNVRYVDVFVSDADGRPVSLARASRRSDAAYAQPQQVRAGHFRTWVKRDAKTLELGVFDARDVAGRSLGVNRTMYVGPVPDGSLSLQFEKGGVIYGRLVSEEGVGIADVSVHYGPREPNWLDKRAPYAARTDAEGRFRFDGLRAGEGQVRVAQMSGWYAPPPPTVRVGDSELTVRLIRPRVIAGRVVGPEQETLEGARVTTRLSEGAAKPKFPFAPRDATTDADGAFQLAGIPPGAVVDVSVAFPAASEYLRRTVVRVAAGTTDLLIAAQKAAAFEGVLMGPLEEPISGARLRLDRYYLDDANLRGGNWRSDGKSTSFRIPKLEPGAYRLSFSRIGSEYATPEPMRIEIPRSEPLVIQLSRLHPLRGRVLNAGREVRIRFLKTDEVKPVRQTSSRHVGRDGRFTLPNDEDVRGTVLAETRDGRFAVLEGIRPSEGPFELTLEAGGRIAGRIEGFPRDLAQVLKLRLCRDAIRYETTVDRDGNFRFPHLVPAGEYAIEAQAERMRGRITGPEAVRAGEESLVLRYEPPGE